MKNNSPKKVRILNEDAVLSAMKRNEVLVSFLGRGEPSHFVVDLPTLTAIRRRLEKAVGILLVGEENAKENKIELNQLNKVVVNGRDTIFSRHNHAN